MTPKLLSVTRKRYLAIDKDVRQFKKIRIDEELLANIAGKKALGLSVDKDVELAMAAIAKDLGHSAHQEPPKPSKKEPHGSS